MAIPTTCPKCLNPVSPTDKFCPRCGMELVPKLLYVSIWRLIGIIAVAVLLPPFGLWPGIKYWRKGDEQAKIVGIVAIVITVISTIITIWISAGILDSVNQTLNTVNTLNGL